MNASIKLGLYVVAVLGTLIFGILFARSWRQLTATEAGGASPAVSEVGRVAGTASKPKPGAGSEATPPSATATNATEGALVEVPPSTNEVVSTEREAASEPARIAVSGRGWSRLLLWGFLALISVAGLGALIAYDVTQYAGNRATDSLFDHDGEGIPESIDDQVEKAHGEGDFLEAIRLLRDHLTQNPKAVEAQIRIAELYEKDLNNPLAAALEYEEVLKRPLRPEKRGWTCIHLVNLYTRMDKPDQAIVWLQRIVAECPGTPAAAKAQERLEAAGLEVPEPPDQEPPPPDGPPSHLPPGFRPRNS